MNVVHGRLIDVSCALQRLKCVHYNRKLSRIRVTKADVLRTRIYLVARSDEGLSYTKGYTITMIINKWKVLTMKFKSRSDYHKTKVH